MPRGDFARRYWLLPALWLATFAVYYPALHGGLLWDDGGHLTRAGLRSTAGLWRVWFQFGATQQYYPVVHSAFWIFNRLWAHNPVGYHLVNISLHATSAFLVATILSRLSVPGAVLAATIFALHPVEVESVAWMTELKNTLSGVCYLAAFLAYLQFDARRERRFYRLAFALFLAALLSKTVTATLPAALLVVFWWRRGRLDWRNDVKPLLPFFAIGLAGGLLTAWVERTFIVATGPDFHLTLVERTLIAGRAVWFYLRTLVWPAHLAFIYSRWPVDQRSWWQYLYPAGVVGALWLLWRVRGRSRAPLAAALLFCGTLFPALGFFNVYSFRYAFVADHFQYLAGIPIIALLSAATIVLASRIGVSSQWGQTGAILALGIPLALVSSHRSRDYVDHDTLFRATLIHNPTCWMCHTNLALSAIERGDLDDAESHLRESLRLNANNAETHNDLGGVLQRKLRFQEAVDEHRQAVVLNPGLVRAHFNLGLAYWKLGRYEDSAAEFREVIRLRPNLVEAEDALRVVLQDLRRQER